MNHDISEAIVVWTGFKEAVRPVRDVQRLVDCYGPGVAAELLPTVRSLENDFYSSGAVDHIGDLAEAGDSAAVEFRSRHPELSEDAVAALKWCFTYDWK